MSKWVKEITCDKEITTIEFVNGRTLKAPTDFFEFASNKLTDKPWNILDLVTKDDFIIAAGKTDDFPTKTETIWFKTQYLSGSCGITTAWYWYQNPDKLGQKVTGKKLPNNHKVSDKDIVLI